MTSTRRAQTHDDVGGTADSGGGLDGGAGGGGGIIRFEERVGRYTGIFLALGREYVSWAVVSADVKKVEGVLPPAPRSLPEDARREFGRAQF